MSDEIVEISKSRLSALEGSSKLINDLWNDPKLGMKVKAITKEKFPNSNIPELDAVNEVHTTEERILTAVKAEKKTLEDRITAFEKNQQERDEKEANSRAESSFAADVEATKKKYQLSPEGMEKVFARMKEKNNPDVEAAAAWVTDHQAPAKPLDQPGYGSQSMDFQNSFNSAQDDKDWELLNKNPFDMKFADQEIRRITQDFNNGRGHLYGANGMGGEL